MTARATDEQRLAFGRVADLYDRARPSYPTSVIDELLDRAGLHAPAQVLEVGAGTGKLTRLLAARGLELLQTHQDHILLEPPARERLLAAIAETVDAAGGTIVLSFATRLCLARRM